jgi:hypothetical protein
LKSSITVCIVFYFPSFIFFDKKRVGYTPTHKKTEIMRYSKKKVKQSPLSFCLRVSRLSACPFGPCVVADVSRVPSIHGLRWAHSGDFIWRIFKEWCHYTLWIKILQELYPCSPRILKPNRKYSYNRLNQDNLLGR